jgi:hypothetical protein
MGTVILLVALVLIAGGGWYIVRHTPKNIDPAPIDGSWSPIGAFYRHRPDRDTEQDFGDAWTSTTDPGASFEVSWIEETSELVVLRQQAHANLAFGGGLVSAIPDGIDPRATGMKVLAIVELAEVVAADPKRLRPLPDGLDQLTAALGRPYQPPHLTDPHWSAAAG